MQGIVLYDTV